MKKARVYKESEKVDHTTHWDLDYLPLKEVEALYAGDERTPALDARKKTRLEKAHLRRLFKRLPAWLVLLIVILLFGRFAITLVFHLLSTSS